MLKEDDIKLFPHNEKAYQSLINSLKNYPLAFIEHATGTGKSMIILKYLYQKMREKRILFISMHDEMFSQLFDNQMLSLGMNKNDFKNFDTLIYPNILKYDMQDIIKKYDCIVFDEAHHCGADKWGDKVLELKELVLSTPDKEMIGLTATGTRYLDNYMDVSELYFDGHTVSRLPISTSILNNLLPAPLYINSLRSSLEYLYKIEKKLKKIPNNQAIITYKKRIEELKHRIETENSIPEFLRKYNVKSGEKYIIFCKNIKDLEQKKKEAEGWFKEIGPIKIFSAHSGQKKNKNISEIEEFSKKRNEISLMFAVDIFNEGFHIDGVDGVLMFRKTKSPIVYFQQIGRALSFSVRRKQIKIFDFVNNIAESDIIYNLYKEMIIEAHKLIKENPSNKELYEEILKRFKIIDETTSIIEELKEIEKDLDENYIVKNNLINSIHKLEEYRQFYPNTNFKEELVNRRLSPDYVNAYKYICHMDEYLTTEQIITLKKLNIDFNSNINLSLEKREEMLESCINIHELKEKKLNEFIIEYITFYQKFNHRPSKSDNPNELELYFQYRYYLENLSLSKIKKIVNSFPFPPTIEELILLSSYPEKGEIEKYIDYIEKKLKSNQALDNVELKVIKKISKLITLQTPLVINYINNYDDINLKIENAISIIAKYKKEVNPKEKFDNLNSIIGEKELYNAIKIIYKYAKRIINSQFEKLLELNIKLPHKIDMTLEHRLELLKGYNSFYELEKGYNSNTINEYITFINKHKRRPNNSNPKEKELFDKYIYFLKNASFKKIKEICHLLKEYNIELSFFEKAINGEYISQEEINEFLFYIENKLKNAQDISKEECRILKALERKESVDKEYIVYLQKQISAINKIKTSLQELKDKDNRTLNKSKLKITREIREYYKFITKELLDEMIALGIEIPNVLTTAINSLTEDINLFAKERRESIIFITSFISYIKNNKKRPPIESKLYSNYCQYISRLSHIGIVKFIELLTENDIPLNFEEKALIGTCSEKEKEEYIKKIESKINEENPLDDLEKRVYNRLKRSGALRKKIKLKSDLNPDSIEDKIVSNLRLCIEKNPNIPINYNNSVYRISAINQKKLEQFRLNILSNRLFKEIIKILKQTREPTNACLNEETKRRLSKYSELSFLDEENKALLHQIRNLDIDNKLYTKGLKKKTFIESYISFIIANNRRPSLITENESELQLALIYDDMKNYLSKKDFSKIESVISKSINETERVDFYEAYYSFITTHSRFPCGNSDNPDEVRLNNLYLTLNKTFTKEQANEIKRLKKLYSKATLQANLKFSKNKAK